MREYGARAPGATVRHREWGPGRVLRRDAERVTVLFDEAGYRTLSLGAVTEHDLLTRESDPGK